MSKGHVWLSNSKRWKNFFPKNFFEGLNLAFWWFGDEHEQIKMQFLYTDLFWRDICGKGMLVWARPKEQLHRRLTSGYLCYFRGVRPFGVSLLIAGWDDDRPYLFQCDPSVSPIRGDCWVKFYYYNSIAIVGTPWVSIKFEVGSWFE